MTIPYLQGYSTPKQFLATQGTEALHNQLCGVLLTAGYYLGTGPLPKTVVDFWRLVWQERPPSIVMITNLEEGNKIKCQQYWPETGSRSFGPFQVTISDEQILTDYTIRKLEVKVHVYILWAISSRRCPGFSCNHSMTRVGGVNCKVYVVHTLWGWRR